MDSAAVAKIIAIVALVAALYLAWKMKKATVPSEQAKFKKQALAAAVVGGVAFFIYHRAANSSYSSPYASPTPLPAAGATAGQRYIL